jgi:hypothetical protein
MDQHNVLRNLFFLLRLKSNIAHEVFGDCGQGVFWPTEEPVDVGITDETREVSASESESISGGRHAQDDMEVIPCTSDEVVPSEFLSIWQLLLSDLFVEWTCESVLLFFWEETWNNTNGKDVVNQLKETLLSNMGVGEHEALLVLEYTLVQIF